MKTRKLRKVRRTVLEPPKYQGLTGTHIAGVLAVLIACLVGLSSAVTVDFADSLNMESSGEYVTAHIEGPLDKVLFADDFELDWVDQDRGEWKVLSDSAGNHFFEARSVETRGTAIFAGEVDWTDYTLEARVYTSDTYWGLIVRADAEGKTYYSAYLNSAEQVAEIWKHTNGMWLRVECDKTPQDFPVIVANQWYDMKIILTGNTIELCYKPVTQADWPSPQDVYVDTSSDPYLEGRVGLIFYDKVGTSTVPLGTYSAWFDDVRVSEASSMLFSDDFEREWDEVSGGWMIEKDLSTTGVGHSLDWVYSPVPAAGVEEITLVTGDTSWTDYTLGYNVRICSDDGGAAREGSAFVRVDDDGLNGYLVHPQVGSDAGICIYKAVAGVYTLMAYEQCTVAVGEWYSITVVASGASISVYLDDGADPVVTYTDESVSPYLSGKIGLRQGAAARHAHFDDVLVTESTYDVSLIDISTLRLCYPDLDSVLAWAVDEPTDICDYDEDGIPDLMVKFLKTEVVEGLIAAGVEIGETVDILVAGSAAGCLDFSGSDSVRTFAKGSIKL